jgi:hypothetical protein
LISEVAGPGACATSSRFDKLTLVVGIAAELRHVHPGAECGSGTRQPDRRHSSILRQPLECLGQKQAKLD